MRVVDYIVDFLIEKEISDVFGFPGGMVTYLIEALDKRRDEVCSHVTYNEQGAAFAACGYAQISLKPGVAYATSGPGATNLITGLCNAYFDSIPAIFITGQVNTYESKGKLKVRQKGFQETDIVSMVKNVTKYSELVTDAQDIRYCLEKAYHTCMEGRPGPVLLDIPMNVQRSEIDPQLLKGFKTELLKNDDASAMQIIKELKKSNRPCLLVGAGVRQSGMQSNLRRLINELKIPVVTSMIAVDTLPTESQYNFGFAGAYGSRYANIILSKCDLLITLGTRLDTRLTGVNLDQFANNAKLIRVDVDQDELSNKIKPDELQIFQDIKYIIPRLIEEVGLLNVHTGSKFMKWLNVCKEIKEAFTGKDDLNPNNLMKAISEEIDDNSVIFTDVGQNQVWTAQSFKVKDRQQVFFSGGHGSMGYSLPAAIGAYYACNGEKRIFSINGDGGIQMNIQELQFIARERLPIQIIIFNNRALGMIRHFQEMYFESNYSQTIDGKGYAAPDFSLIAKAYGLEYCIIRKADDINKDIFDRDKPGIIEVRLDEYTYVFPKLAVNKPIYDQEPPMDRDIYEYIMNL